MLHLLLTSRDLPRAGKKRFEKKIQKTNSEKNDSLIDDSFIIEGDMTFSGSRTERWRYAWYLFSNEYNWYQKLIGKGFSYLDNYNIKFFKGTNIDYPHNPIISAFLFSGLIGGLAYIYFMIIVFWYYIKYWKHHLFFFLCFIVIFYFTFFSANTQFSVPALSIFSIIPFFTKYLVDKERQKDIINSNGDQIR